MAGVGSAVNDTTRNMGSVLGVAVFGSITASVFAGRMGSSIGSLGTAAAAAHQPGSGDDRGLSRWPRREYYTI